MASMWKNPSRQLSAFLKLFHIDDINPILSQPNVVVNTYRKLSVKVHREIVRSSKASLCYHKVHKRAQSNTTERLSQGNNNTIDPFSLVKYEVNMIQNQVKHVSKEIRSSNGQLKSISEYYFDGKGKAFRPMLVMLMARTINFHLGKPETVLPSQLQIAMIAEMIHTASLMHDDVIDHADMRRGKSSINSVWEQRKSILAGDYVMSMASIALAKIRNEQVVSVVSQITEDLVRGEFMQLGSKENENERFTHYLKKTFKKTASLLANSCRAVAILSNGSDEIADIAYEYGKNIGICFQLIDDLLDFTSCDNVMGKPTAADLLLGLATAPVLFAAKTYPELNPMIMRRFSEEGDVETARNLVAKSDGVKQTRQLAEQHSTEALSLLKTLTTSSSLKGLESISELVLNRNK